MESLMHETELSLYKQLMGVMSHAHQLTDEEERLSFLLKGILYIFNVDRVRLYLFKGDALVPRMLVGEKAENFAHDPDMGDRGVIKEAIETGRTVHFRNLKDDPYVDEDLSRLHGVSSLVVVPLRVRGERLGVLCADLFDDTRRMSDREVDVLKEFCDVAATLINYDRVYNALENYISKLTHDMKSPLTNLLGFVGLLQSGRLGEVTPQQKDAYAVMERGAKRLSRLIEKMRNFARIKSGSIKLRTEPVSVREVFNQIVEIFAYLIQESGVKVSLDGSVKEVVADRDCMESIFKNLIGNALRHTPKGGTVRVTVEEDARFWYFHVFNSGSFIPENLRERIFEEYVTFDEEMGGTGLGLTIVKSFVEAHRGNVLVNSDELGTTFSFTIKKRAPQTASVAMA